MSEAYVAATVRREVRERANGRCEYCLLAEDDSYYPHEAEHIISIKHGGVSAPENLAWSCFDCNRFKGSDIGSIDTVSGDLTRLFHPRQDHWRDHFQLVDAQVLPLTPVGRVTVVLLKLNLPQRVEIRATLTQSGRYPRGM